MTSQFSWQPLAKLCNDFSIFFAAPGQAVGWCWAGGCERTCWVPGKLLNSIIIIIFSKSIIVIFIELHAPNSQNSRLVLFEFSLCWNSLREVPSTLEDTTDLSPTKSPRLWDRLQGITPSFEWDWVWGNDYCSPSGLIRSSTPCD